MGAMGLMSLLALTGCSDDSGEYRQAVTFEAQPCATGFMEEGDVRHARTAGTTRAWDPTTSLGYYLYNDYHVLGLFKEQTDLFYKSIDVFFTRDSKAPLHGTFFYKTNETNESKWRLDMDIEDTDDYYVYGYIPKEVVSSADINGNSTYSEGAELTLTGIKTVTHSDLCVIVGASEGTDENSPAHLSTGQFKVNANRVQRQSANPSGGGSNYIYLLFDHLYSALAFNFTIDATYHALRTIKLTKLELIGYANANETNIKAKYNAVIKLKSTTDGTSPIKEVTFSPDPNSDDLAFEPIYTGDEVELNPVTPTKFMGCFVPGQNTYFKLRSTYDVYDKNGYLIRKGCEAENTINLTKMFDTSVALRGQMFKITIKVIPTYLYMLSEPDLDNPSLTIEN